MNVLTIPIFDNENVPPKRSSGLNPPLAPSSCNLLSSAPISNIDLN